MEIWLRQGGNAVRIPVLPPSYSITSNQINKVVNINALGEINLIGNRGLTEISFSSIFPFAYQSYCEYYPINTPKEYIDSIEAMKLSGDIRLTITETSINMMVTIENFQYGEEDGSGDISYSLEFKEYILPNTAEVTRNEKLDTSRETPQANETVSYLVKEGDCLSAVAMKLTGKSDWKPLYEQNKDTIGNNPNLIHAGMTLLISGARKGI